MEIFLDPVARDQREILSNLLEKYCYEFSQYDGQGVDEFGLFGYPPLDAYWSKENHWAYFIRVDGALAGLVMINDYQELKDRTTDFQVAEFFVTYKYRGKGVGMEAFFQALKLHHGTWQLKYHPKNTVSASFWKKAVDSFTSGKNEFVASYPGTEYPDGSPGSYYFFES